jgi:hypothetical protein
MANHRKRNRIAGQFTARPIQMLENPAYRVLSRAAHQVLARVDGARSSRWDHRLAGTLPGRRAAQFLFVPC